MKPNPVIPRLRACQRGLAALLLSALTLPLAAAEPEVAYPAGYRDWRHVPTTA